MGSHEKPGYRHHRRPGVHPGGSEDAGYTKKVADHVDAKVQEVLDGAHVSLVDGAILPR